MPLSKILAVQMWSAIGPYAIKCKRSPSSDRETFLPWTIGDRRVLTGTTAVARVPHISRLVPQAIDQLCVDVIGALRIDSPEHATRATPTQTTVRAEP